MTTRPGARPRVLFVGAFAPSGPDGTVGGITFACRSLLAAEASAGIDWVLIDSTASTNRPRSLLERTRPALGRLVRFVRGTLGRRPDRVVIFSAHGGSFWEKGLMALIAARRSIPVVFAPRSGFLEGELAAGGRQAAFARRVFARCERIVCQSETWRDFYARFCDDPAKLVVVPNWIDLARYPVGAEDEKFPVVTVLYVAWVVREKGIWELLEALRELEGRVATPYEVIVCGDGGELDAARDFAREAGLDHVRFRGWVGGEEKAELLRRAHVFVLPSWYEGLSNSLLEAMASGLAVVSSDVGAAADVVEDGVSGHLVPSRDSAPLAARLASLLDSPSERARLGRAARERIAERHAIEVGVPRFLGLVGV